MVTAHALPLAVCWPAVAGHMCVHVQLMNVRARVVYMCVVCRRNARRGRSGWGSRAERAQLSIGSGVRAHVRGCACACVCVPGATKLKVDRRDDMRAATLAVPHMRAHA